MDALHRSGRRAIGGAQALADTGARHAAVLVLLVDGDDGAEVLLTRRSRGLRSHAGEMSFPGGRLDPGEDFVAAALRETTEEVGVSSTAIEIVGGLEPMETFVSNSLIVPVVGVAPRRMQVRPHGSEVDRVLWTPLRDLTTPGTYHEEIWPTERGDHDVHFFDLDDETVWGATARMLREVLVAVHAPPPATRTAV